MVSSVRRSGGHGPPAIRAPVKLRMPGAFMPASARHSQTDSMEYDVDEGLSNYSTQPELVPYDQDGAYDQSDEELDDVAMQMRASWDPDFTGTFPKNALAYRPPSLARMPEPRHVFQAPDEPFMWVPRPKDEDAHYMRPTPNEIPHRTETTLPLEMFDDPELERVDPVEYLQQLEGDARPGVTARSRYYQNGGQFTWAPCYVLGYLE